MPHLIRFVNEKPLREGAFKFGGAVFAFSCFTVPGPIYVALKIAQGSVRSLDYLRAGVSLSLIYIALSFFLRRAEPKDFILDRLSGRIRRATVFRSVANAAGIGVVGALFSARFGVAHPAPLISTAVTLLVTMALVTHKTFARARKLCTQVHADVQALLRDLDDLDRARGRGKRAGEPPTRLSRLLPRQEAGGRYAEKQGAALRSWDALKRSLSTTVDTGYRLIGLPFLADEVVAEMDRRVIIAIELGISQEIDRVRVDLQAIRDVCAGSIDVLA
jgi:hypothetical protein